MNREKFLSAVTDAFADSLRSDDPRAPIALANRLAGIEARAARRYKRILAETYNNVANPGETQRRLRRFAANAELRVMAETLGRAAFKAGIDRGLDARPAAAPG